MTKTTEERMKPRGRLTGRRPAGALATVAGSVVRRRWLTLMITTLIAGAATVLGAGTEHHLSAGGYTAESFESVRADVVLTSEFGAGAPNVVLVASSAAGVDDAGAAEAGRQLTRRIERSSDSVSYARSYWTTNDPGLRSADGRSALIVVRLLGDENEVARLVHDVVPQFVGRQGDLEVRATGAGVVNAEADRLSAEDLTRSELIAAPLTVLVLVIVFRSLIGALLPVVVGAVSVAGTLAVLRVLAEATPVSIFAMNLTTALGFGLAVDYSLFIVNRYREELGAGRGTAAAIVTSVRTAGRTVLFSAMTVTLSLAALLVFPIYFLRSLAYAGFVVVALASITSVILLPALLAVVGPRIDRFDVTALLRRRRAGSGGRPGRLSALTVRRPLVVAVAVVILLGATAVPFLRADFGLLDDRVLPRGASAQVAAEAVRTQFPSAQTAPIVVVLGGGDPVTTTAVADYARRLSVLPHAAQVDSPAGTFVAGQAVARSRTSAGMLLDNGTRLLITADLDPNSRAAETLVRAVRATPAPSGALVGGDAATLVDTKDMLTDRIGWAAAVIALSMIVLLFLFTGSIVIPLQQLVLNALSLTASFGAMVYVFQEGHLKWLVGDFVHTGRLEVTVPILMFCVAFGLSMDYSVFVLSRIREHYLDSGDTTRSVAFGLKVSGRLITAAALVVAVALGAVATSGLSVLKLLGVGLALAVLVDATLVRGLLLPAVMRLFGRRNWWAPNALARIHRAIGLRESR